MTFFREMFAFDAILCALALSQHLQPTFFGESSEPCKTLAHLAVSRWRSIEREATSVILMVYDHQSCYSHAFRSRQCCAGTACQFPPPPQKNFERMVSTVLSHVRLAR